MPEPHIILGVSHTCYYEEAKTAWYKLCLKHHPDKIDQHGKPEEVAMRRAQAEEKTKALNAAWAEMEALPRRPKEETRPENSWGIPENGIPRADSRQQPKAQGGEPHTSSKRAEAGNSALRKEKAAPKPSQKKRSPTSGDEKPAPKSAYNTVPRADYSGQYDKPNTLDTPSPCWEKAAHKSAYTTEPRPDYARKRDKSAKTPPSDAPWDKPAHIIAYNTEPRSDWRNWPSDKPRPDLQGAKFRRA